MNSIEKVFSDIYSFAKKYSTCNKVYVGCMIQCPDGTKIYSANSGEGHNCQTDGKCYKYEVTGIYESCEETRKFCASTHSEINAIKEFDKLEVKYNPEECVVYVTRYPCENCAENLVKRGFKKIVYCGRQEISSSVKSILESNGVSYEWYKDIDFESDNDKVWWTKQFASKAYDLVKDNKYPIIIPSYNRPNAPALVSGFLSKMDDNKNFPIYVFVRSSQYDDYVKGLSSNRYVNIVGIPDELMIGAGAARRQSLKWLYNQGYKAAFSFDDDLLGIGYTEKGFTGSGDLKSKAVPNTNVCDTLAMWQISMSKAIEEHNVMISGLMPMGFSWKMEYCWPEQSMLYYRGLPSQAVCLNVAGLVENGLIYGDNKDVGHEDIDLTIRIVDSGNSVCVFPFMYHSAPPMSVENWGFNNMVERFSHQQSIMRKNHENKDWVKFAEKRGIPQVSINWQRVRKQFGVSKYIIDIWRNGELVKGI